MLKLSRIIITLWLLLQTFLRASIMRLIFTFIVQFTLKFVNHFWICVKHLEISLLVLIKSIKIKGNKFLYFNFDKGGWKLQKKSHFYIASEVKFTFWVDKSSLKMQKKSEVLKNWSIRSNSVTRQAVNAKIEKWDILSSFQTMCSS